MNEDKQFEKEWQERLKKSLEKAAGEEVCQKVMMGNEELLENYKEENATAWTKEVITRLEDLVDNSKVRDIMTQCACHYPHEKLQDLEELYLSTGDIDKVHKLLQERFEKKIKKYKRLSDEEFDCIIKRGWGEAGVKKGNIIYATKMPADFHKYFKAKEKKEKAYCYCHCTRIKAVIKNNDKLSANYCYCGAGFYKDIWEEILQKPVKVEVIKSVLKGDDVCQIKIYLPLK